MTLNKETYQWSQREAEKCSCGMDRLQDGPRYAPKNLDNIMSENVQIIWQIHKFHHECHGKLELPSEGQTLVKIKIQWIIFLL